MAERVDSRKRKNDDYGGVPVIASKRGGPSSEQVVVDGFMIKVLCPESLAGYVIGKKGAALNDIIANSGATAIKLSQQQQLYPGTNERTLSIRGSSPQIIKDALEGCIRKICEGQSKHPLPPPPSARASQQSTPTSNTSIIRLSIPQNCGGAVIGAGGTNVRRIVETSSCTVRVADAADPYGTKERLITFSATSVDNVVRATHLVLDILTTECIVHFVYIIPDVVYSAPMVPMHYAPQQGYFPPPTHYQQAPPPAYSSAPPMQSYPPSQHYLPPPPYYPPQEPSPSDPRNQRSVPPPSNPPQQAPYRDQRPAYPPPPVHPQHLPQYPPQYPQEQALYPPAPQHPQYSHAPAPSQYYPHQPPPLQQYPSQYSLGATGTDVADIPPPTYAADGQGGVIMTLLVPEKYMGGVLGKGGSVVKQISEGSGATIKASQRGEYIEGYAEFRAVKAIGSNAQVQVAQGLIMNRIVEVANNPRGSRAP